MGFLSSKGSRSESYSSLLLVEALLVSGVGAYYLYQSGVEAGWAVGVGLVGTLVIRQILVYVKPVFWLWTLILGVLAAYFSYHWFGNEIDRDSALLVAGAAFFVVLVIHMLARRHSRIEDHFW